MPRLTGHLYEITIYLPPLGGEGGGDNLSIVFEAVALWANAFYKSKCLSVCLFVSLFVCLFVCSLEVLFKRIFAPTSQSPISKHFRDSESFGKNNERKWFHI